MNLFSRIRESVPLSTEGHLPSFEGATGWLNSPPLTPDGLRGKVVLVDFWTYTCINWLRTLGYVRAWADRYVDHGLVVIGVHTPEFPFERDVENIRAAVAEMRVTYPVAIDSEYRVWRAFDNNYWPAVYIADAEGRIRHHHHGEGGYEECERVVQQLLHDAGASDVPDDLVSVADEGFEAQADWSNLGSPETYLGFEQGRGFASPEGAALDERAAYSVPEPLALNEWALRGDWTIGRGVSRLAGRQGALAFRFRARDVNLVMGPRAKGDSVPFVIKVDGRPPGGARGLDVDEAGNGTLTQQRLHQLVRRREGLGDATFEITFGEPGAEAYCFTFG